MLVCARRPALPRPRGASLCSVRTQYHTTTHTCTQRTDGLDEAEREAVVQAGQAHVCSRVLLCVVAEFNGRDVTPTNGERAKTLCAALCMDAWMREL
jgi:hypothetical protein